MLLRKNCRKIKISYKLSINLYDIVGRRVKAFVDAKKEPGSYSLDCDIRNYGSGVYFLRLESGKYKTVEKVLLIK
ncbi:hypothetical protein CH333_03195 [candidate division WOR-3 bacterium JGI_Cruoil_03_44_89]|uniref:Secretion system C-terminal sorting domain-containing protein n=1 Tax=candidate division WOR-3 bacterium JGI_Cruoil_03_44_89 TaxID=1973748 RepID=A0A235BWL3_UNCW3|nr:MAG: hypothetical protein CH333_03195 [candidate division WOR-3 bacterium JGI_Cruoil_03_44_89]